MRFRSALGFALGTSIASIAFAADEAVLVTVGEAKLTASEVSTRLSRVPAFQLARYGTSPGEARSGYVDQVLVPELLMAQEAAARKLDQAPRVRDKLRDALRDAMDRALRDELASKGGVSDDEVKGYFEQNRARFETPERIRVWRILVADEAKAKSIIELAKGTDGPKRWSQAARDDSLDKATALRNGDLGFVRADGSTDTPRVKVKPELFAAAQKLADGAVAEQPIREGDGFAVIWRRGSMPAVKRTLEQESGSIRTLLERRKAQEARTALLASLKRDGLKEQHPELLEHIGNDSFEKPAKRERARKEQR